MATEHEIKLLGIDEAAIKTFLQRENIELSENLEYKRVVFDTIPSNESAWIRLRTDGKKTTLTYKNSTADTIDGMQELEVETESFEGTIEILKLAGLTPRNYQENKREVYYAFDCMITVDYWPLIPPYVEIEAESKELVERCLQRFKGLYENTSSKPTEFVYKTHGIDLRAIDSLKFIDTQDFLHAKLS